MENVKISTSSVVLSCDSSLSHFIVLVGPQAAQLAGSCIALSNINIILRLATISPIKMHTHKLDRFEQQKYYEFLIKNKIQKTLTDFSIFTKYF